MDNDKELFESALSDEAPEIVADTPAEQPAAEIEGQPRDESGRFAPKAAEPEPQPEPQAAQPQPAKDEAHVPSWRLREVREENERKLAERDAHWQRQFEALQRQNQPPPAPQEPIDPYADPEKFRDMGVKQAVDPIQQRLQQITEFQSERFAVSKHGAEKVEEAKKALATGVNSRDPEAIHTWQRAMQSLDPYGDIMGWHQQRQTLQRVGPDPEAWFGKTLDERLASDPKFAGELMQKLQQSVRGQPQGQSKIALPPSLSRVAASRGASEEDNDPSDAAMFRHAMR